MDNRERAAGWLIEREDDQQWAIVLSDKLISWTRDSLKALRFARKEEAELFAELAQFSGPIKVTEHVWMESMRTVTDFHSVNLSTGEKTRSIVGDGQRVDEVVGPCRIGEARAAIEGEPLADFKGTSLEVQRKRPNELYHVICDTMKAEAKRLNEDFWSISLAGAVHDAVQSYLAGEARASIGLKLSVSEGRLRETLAKLVNECGAVLAFEHELREISVLGNTNVNAFKLRVDEARAALEQKCGAPDKDSIGYNSSTEAISESGSAGARQGPMDALIAPIEDLIAYHEKYARAT